MKKQQSIKMNYIYNLSYQVLAMIIPFITTPYVARVLGADGNGNYSFALSIVSYFSVIGNLGLSTYGQLKIAKERDSKEVISIIFWEVEISRWILLTLSFVVYSIFIIKLGYGKQMIFWVVALNILATAFDISWFFQGIEEFRKIVLRNLVIKIISTALIFIIVKKHEDVCLYGMVIQGSLVIGNIMLWPYLKDQIKLRIHGKIKISNSIWQGWIYFIPTIATSIYTMLDKSMIGWITRSNVENGYYEQSYKLIQMATIVVTSLSAVIMPRMTYLYKQGKEKKMAELFENALNMIVLLAVPIVCGIIAVAKIFIPIYLGQGYTESVLLTIILAPMVLFTGLNNAIGMQCLIPRGKQKQYNYGVICGAVINFILNAITIFLLGARGAAISSVFSEISIFCVFLYASREQISFVKFIKDSYKKIFAGIIMLGMVYEISRKLEATIANLSILIFIGIIVYFGILWIEKDKFLIYSINYVKRKILRN